MWMGVKHMFESADRSQDQLSSVANICYPIQMSGGHMSIRFKTFPYTDAFFVIV